MSPVHPRLAVSMLSMWDWPLQPGLDLLRDLGVISLGVLYRTIAEDPEGAAAAIAAAGLRCSNVTADNGGTCVITPDQGEGSPALRALKPSLDFAAAVGRVPCYFTTGKAPERMPTDEAFDQLIPAMAPVAAYAAGIGVPLALEHNNAAMHDAGFVHSLRDCIAFAEATGLGVCVELQNCWTERDLPRLIREHVARFTVVQVSDYLVGETSRMNRRVLGDGSIPLEWLLGHLLDAGYAGMFEIETMGPAIEQEGYAGAIRRSVDWLNERLVKWGA